MSDTMWLGMLVGIGCVVCALLGALVARLGHVLQALERLERPVARWREPLDVGEEGEA